MTGDLANNWDEISSEFEDYMLAKGLKEKGKDVQAATLRRVMGSECCHQYKHNLGLSEEQAKDPTAILDALEAHFKLARNVIFERYIFGNCKQDEGEPIDAFVTRLREKAASCEYRDLKEDLIRDRLVLGVCDEALRRCLLREKKLTLASAIEICRAGEMTDMSLKAMTHDRPPETVHATDSCRPRAAPRQTCYDRSLNQAPGVSEGAICRFCA